MLRTQSKTTSEQLSHVGQHPRQNKSRNHHRVSRNEADHGSKSSSGSGSRGRRSGSFSHVSWVPSTAEYYIQTGKKRPPGPRTRGTSIKLACLSSPSSLRYSNARGKQALRIAISITWGVRGPCQHPLKDACRLRRLAS